MLIPPPGGDINEKSRTLEDWGECERGGGRQVGVGGGGGGGVGRGRGSGSNHQQHLLLHPQLQPVTPVTSLTPVTPVYTWKLHQTQAPPVTLPTPETPETVPNLLLQLSDVCLREQRLRQIRQTLKACSQISQKPLIKGISHKKFFCSNLIFGILMGCGIQSCKLVVESDTGKINLYIVREKCTGRFYIVGSEGFQHMTLSVFKGFSSKTSNE